VFLEDVKQIFLAFNCLYRGSGTLMVNLLQNIPLYENYQDPWLAQYGDGAANKLYEVPVNPLFVGHSFTCLSYYIYREFQVILIGINGLVPGSEKSRHVVLNPGSKYLLAHSDHCFFIAPSKADVDAIAELVCFHNCRILASMKIA
jgi:Calcium-activated BK potassium channel alpha subunit